MPPRNADDVTARTETRDRGLRRVRRATGLVTAASAAGAVILAGGYAHAMPGEVGAASRKALPSTAASRPAPEAGHPTAGSTPTAGSAPTQSTHTTPAAASSAPGLKAPAQPPTTTANSAPSQATSGGS